MKMSRAVSLLAFLLFAATFYPPNWPPVSGGAVSALLTGVKEASASPGDKGIPGYLCAYTTIALPWTADGVRMLSKEPVEFFAILISGWINPVFLVAFILLFVNSDNRLGRILRIVLLLMFPACWVVFYKDHLYPRTGYFLWTAAMLLALFAPKIFPGRRLAENVHIG